MFCKCAYYIAYCSTLTDRYMYESKTEFVHIFWIETILICFEFGRCE